MKDILGKLTELEATAPKVTKKKMLSEDSAKPPMNAETKPTRFKDIFETMASTKPIPVVGKQGDTQSSGAGFLNVTDNSPAAVALGNALGDLAQQKKVQIVVPTQPGQPAPAGATGQQPAGQMQMKEKWDAETKVAPSEKGKYAGKNKAELTKAYNKLKASGPHKKGSPEFGKMRELAFAIRAKSDWGKVQEEQLDEKLTKSMSAGEIISDFEKSKDPKFKGKSKEERKKQALGAYYGMHPEKSKKKVKEGDIAPTSGIDTMGAGLGAGRSQTTLEGKKPDFLDLDKDGNKKESMKKAAADKKKKKVDESMNHRISAARLEGKSHGLRGHAHSGKRYEDLEELKAYHEGYKEGLDECYGQGVYENAMPATVPGMASAAMPSMPAMEDEMEEGNAFTAALAKTPKGGKFSVGGKTFTDRTSYDAKVNEYAFESLDKQLNALLNESEEVNEGLSVSVSKGQQNAPDSVTITAQDAEADQLLQLVKHAGLGLFGDEAAHEPSSAMSIQPAHGAPDEVGAGGVDIDVVDGSDDMLGLMKKLSGVEASGAEDYADEEGGCDCEEGNCDCDKEEANEEACMECGGMMEAGHSCGSKEMVDEVESEDQMEFKVAEDNAPDSGAAETTADEEAEAEEDKALALKSVNESFFDLLDRLDQLSEGSGDKPKHPEHDKKDDKDFDDEEDGPDYGKAWYDTSDELKEEELNEWANNAGKKGTDASFEADIEFMTKVIAGGLNKPKSTGQTTVPVIAGQTERMHDHQGSVSDTVDDWVKLAGVK